MTPNEIFSIEPLAVRPWHDLASVSKSVLGIPEWDDYDDVIEKTDPGRLLVHEKLDIDLDGRRGVSIYALYLDGKPFAIMCTGGRDHRDARDAFVTDAEVWGEARRHAIELANRHVTYDGDLSPPTAELLDGYYGAKIGLVNGEPRLVSPSDLSPVTGNAVFDSRRFEQAFAEDIRPLGNKIGSERGLEDPRMLGAAVAAVRNAAIGRLVEVEHDLGGGAYLAAISVVDELAFAHVLKTTGKHYQWSREIGTHMIGPASIAQCYLDRAAGLDVGTDNKYVVAAARAFGANAEDVRRELVDFMENGGDGMAERIVMTLPRDPRVDPLLDDDYATFAFAYMVRDDLSLRQFSTNGSPTLEMADKTIALAEKIVAGKSGANDEVPRP